MIFHFLGTLFNFHSNSKMNVETYRWKLIEKMKIYGNKKKENVRAKTSVDVDLVMNRIWPPFVHDVKILHTKKNKFISMNYLCLSFWEKNPIWPNHSIGCCVNVQSVWVCAILMYFHLTLTSFEPACKEKIIAKISTYL